MPYTAKKKFTPPPPPIVMSSAWSMIERMTRTLRILTGTTELIYQIYIKLVWAVATVFTQRYLYFLSKTRKCTIRWWL